jgi:hypothetical protein
MTMRRWCRAALVMTVVASATLSWTAGAGTHDRDSAAG